MKFCGNCGAKIDDNALFCPSCGAKSDASAENISTPSPEIKETFEATPVTVQNAQKKSNGFAVAGFVLAIVSLFSWLCCVGYFTSILAIIFSAIGLAKIKETGEDGRGLAIAGLIIGILGIVATLIISIVFAAVDMTGALSEIYDYI